MTDAATAAADCWRNAILEVDPFSALRAVDAHRNEELGTKQMRKEYPCVCIEHQP